MLELEVEMQQKLLEKRTSKKQNLNRLLEKQHPPNK